MVGEASVAELAEDFAAAADLPTDRARALVGGLVVRLHDAGIIEPIVADFPDFSDVERTDVPADTIDSDPDHEPDFADELAEALRDSKTEEFIVETLPDGRKQVRAKFSMESEDTDRRAQLVTEVLAGDRALAELAPADSCLGFKLRIGNDADRISVSRNGVVLTIRCDHPKTTATLREALANWLVDESGPVAAFVVAPLEGDGPCRVFDALGRRHGRPRSTSEVVDLVLHLLHERFDLRTRANTRIHWGVLQHGNAAVLVAPALLSQPRLGAASRNSGFTLIDFRPVLTDEGQILVNHDFNGGSPGDPLDVVGIVMADDGSFEHPGPHVAKVLLDGEIVDDVTERNATLAAIAKLVSNATLSPTRATAPESTLELATSIVRRRTGITAT